MLIGKRLRQIALLCCLPVALMKGDDRFWEKQEPGAWTPEQVTQFETVSPWAKQVTAVLTSNDSNMAGSSPRAGGGGGRRGGAVYSSRGSSTSTTPGIPKFTAIVRWQNQPMQKLLKLKLPESCQGHYVVSVTGLPIGEDPSSLIEQTTLQLKRGGPVHPESAYQDPNDTATIYFAFLPSTLDISNAKVAEFKMDAAPFEVKTKFNLAEMKLHGETAY